MCMYIYIYIYIYMLQIMFLGLRSRLRKKTASRTIPWEDDGFGLQGGKTYVLAMSNLYKDNYTI